MCRFKALPWLAAIWQVEVALINSTRSSKCDKNIEIEPIVSSPSGRRSSWRIAGKCTRKRPRFSGRCYPSTTGLRVFYENHGWCCECPDRATWNPGTKECVCEGAPFNGVDRILPDKKTRECPTPDKIGLTEARDGYDEAMSQVKKIQNYCNGRRTLEEFIPGSGDGAQYFSMRMGLSGDTAIAIKNMIFAGFYAKMTLSATSSGMSLEISDSVIHISLQGVIVWHSKGFIDVEQVDIKGKVSGKESTARLARFGGPLNIVVEPTEVSIKGVVKTNKGNHGNRMPTAALGIFKETIEQKVIGKLVFNICKGLAFAMRGVALDSTLSSPLQGHTLWPLKFELTLCDEAVDVAFKTLVDSVQQSIVNRSTSLPTKVKGVTCVAMQLEAGERDPLAAWAIFEANGFASLKVTVNLKTGFQGPELLLQARTELRIDLARILRSFADNANDAVRAIALGKAVAEPISEQDNDIKSCHDATAPTTLLGSAGRWVKGVVATGTSMTVGLSAKIAANAVYGTYHVLNSALDKARGTKFSEIPTEAGAERAAFERDILKNWQDEPKNQNRVGVLLPDRDGKETNPDFYIAGFRSVEIHAAAGTLKAGARDPSGTLRLKGELELPQVQISGLVYDIFEKREVAGYTWKNTGVDDWDISLGETVIATVEVGISKSDGISACALVPVESLRLDTHFRKYDIIAKGFMWAQGAKLKAFVGKAIESAIVPLLESALSSAPNLMTAATINFEMGKEEEENVGGEEELVFHDCIEYEDEPEAADARLCLPGQERPKMMHRAVVTVDEISDWGALGTLQAHFAAIPPDVASDREARLAPNASVEFGRGWNLIPFPAPDDTAEKLSFEPEVWLNQDLYKSLDFLIPGMSLGGELDMSEKSTKAMVFFQGHVWADIDALLRSSLNDHGGWIYGDFRASNHDRVVAHRFEVKSQQEKVTSKNVYQAVLSCGALYLLGPSITRNRLRKRDSRTQSTTPLWTEYKGGVFDILDGGLKLIDECAPDDQRDRMPGKGGILLEGTDLQVYGKENKKYWVCIPHSTPMSRAVLWELDRAKHIALMIGSGAYASFKDWSPVLWKYKNSPFHWLPDEEVKQQVEEQCGVEVDACARFMGCMGVAISPCTFLSSRDVKQISRTARTFIKKEWHVGLP